MNTRRSFAAVAIVSALLAVAALPALGAPSKPNILFIMGDDIGT